MSQNASKNLQKRRSVGRERENSHLRPRRHRCERRAAVEEVEHRDSHDHADARYGHHRRQVDSWKSGKRGEGGAVTTRGIWMWSERSAMRSVGRSVGAAAALDSRSGQGNPLQQHQQQRSGGYFKIPSFTPGRAAPRCGGIRKNLLIHHPAPGKEGNIQKGDANAISSGVCA